MSRIERFHSKSTQEQEVFQEIDGEKIVYSLAKETTDLLAMVMKLPAPSFNGSISVNTLSNTVKYQISDAENISLDIRLWSVQVSAQILNSKQILTIFLAIMHEISVVIVCQKASVLTALMHFFHNLIQPIKWIHPVIYSLPESLLTLIESPVPIFVGLNVSEGYVKELELVDKTDNLMFVFIDHEVKMLTRPTNLIQNLKYPYFDGILGKLEGIMKDPVKIRNPSPGLQQQSKRVPEQKPVRFIQDEKDKQNSNQILLIFKKCIQQFIIEKLPKSVERNKDGSIKMDLVEKHIVDQSRPKDREFIKTLFKTQFFSFFIEELYQ